VPSKCEATFTGWSVGKNNNAPTLLLNAVPKGRTTASGFIAPNRDDKKAIKGTINPQAVVNALVPKLKIGDRIKIDFLYLGATRWITNVTLLSRRTATYDGSADSDGMSFRVNSVRSLRIGKIAGKGLRVTKGKMSWTFVVPNVTNPDTAARAPATVPDPAIVAKIERFSRGDEVCVDYDTSDYMFVIKDVRPAVFTETGRVLEVGEKHVISRKLGIDNVLCPQAMVIGSNGTRALLIRPAEAGNAGLTAPSGDLAETLKGFDKNQTIQYKYYVQAGLRWLIEAQASSQTASRS